jgi:hypothetical protein
VFYPEPKRAEAYDAFVKMYRDNSSIRSANAHIPRRREWQLLHQTQHLRYSVHSPLLHQVGLGFNSVQSETSDDAAGDGVDEPQRDDSAHHRALRLAGRSNPSNSICTIVQKKQYAFEPIDTSRHRNPRNLALWSIPIFLELGMPSCRTRFYGIPFKSPLLVPAIRGEAG